MSGRFCVSPYKVYTDTAVYVGYTVAASGHQKSAWYNRFRFRHWHTSKRFETKIFQHLIIFNTGQWSLSLIMKAFSLLHSTLPQVQWHPYSMNLLKRLNFASYATVSWFTMRFARLQYPIPWRSKRWWNVGRSSHRVSDTYRYLCVCVFFLIILLYSLSRKPIY